MGDKKEYRSAIRSRKLIRQAFLELLKEKSFEKITVTDIVKRADINRSTFYAHYPDVMGVIDEIQNEILDYTQNFMENLDFSDFFINPMPQLEGIIKLAKENVELHRLLSASALGAKQLERIKNVVIERSFKTINISEEYKNSFEMEFTVRFFLGGIVDVYTQWLMGNFDCSLEELTEQIARIIVCKKDTYFWLN